MSEFYRSLAREAAARYPRNDRFARHFAFGKLTRDPVFGFLLKSRLITTGARVLDLGCGQGVLEALLAAARERYAEGPWAPGWPAPPNPSRIVGIDRVQREVERARAAAGRTAEFIVGDIRSVGFGAVEAVVALDVLHYIDSEAQAALLTRVRDALAPGGLLLLRVADGSAGLRFRATLAVDRLVMRLRGHRLERLWCKPLAAWREQLTGLGFVVTETPMSQGTPFANVLLVARYDRR